MLRSLILSIAVNNPESKNSYNIFFIDKIVKILIWMMCSKHMKTKLSSRFRGVEEIELIEDISKSYSHAKLSKLFSFSIIKILFELFVTHGKEEFLSNFHGEQKLKYQEALDELMSRFIKNNDA